MAELLLLGLIVTVLIAAYFTSRHPTVEIEICERMGETPKYHAQIKNTPGVWGCGNNRLDALGNVIIYHPEKFNVNIMHLGRLSR
jgi:hypothetical protein